MKTKEKNNNMIAEALWKVWDLKKM